MKHTAKLITDSLLKEYAPLSMILYGSYADGTADADSDFDALLICDDAPSTPRSDVLHGVRLDVHFADAQQLLGEFDPQEYLQVYDGVLLCDENDVGARLIEKVRNFVCEQPQKDKAEMEHLLRWCDKMLLRSQRGDAEGDYRYHWLLTESLMIYCDVCGWYYFGPKKTLKRMEKEDAKAYAAYARALKGMDQSALRAWIDTLHEKFQ